MLCAYVIYLAKIREGGKILVIQEKNGYIPGSDSFLQGVDNFHFDVFDLGITMVGDLHFTQKLKAPVQKSFLESLWLL